MGTIASLMVKITADSSDLRKNLKAVQKQIQETFGDEFMSFSKGAEIGLAGIGAAMTALGVKAVQEAGSLQKVQIAFTNLLGSAEKAGDYIRELQDFAKQTPFTFEDLTTGAQRFMAMGFAADEVIPTLRAVGDAAAGVGLGAEGINRVSLALGQMKAKGAVQSEEMLQLAEAGIPAWDMLAKKLNVDVATAMGMVQKRAVDANTGIAALVEGMNSKYGGIMEQQATSISGSWAIMTDGIMQSLAQLGLKINEAFDLSGAMHSMGVALSEFARNVQDAGIKEALSELVPPELGAAIIGVSTALTSVAIPAIVNTGLALWKLVAPLMAGAVAFAPYIAAASALAAALYYLWQKGVTVAGVFDAMNVSGESIKILMDSLSTVGATLAGVWERLAPIIGAILETVVKVGLVGLVKGLGVAADAFLYFANIVLISVHIVGTGFNWLYDTIASVLSTIADALGLSEAAGDNWGKRMLRSVTDFVSGAIGWLDKYLNKLTDVRVASNWMSSGSSDDYDKLSPGFNIYTGKTEKAPTLEMLTLDTSGAGKGKSTQMSEEERQIEALIKKYADASAQARERGKVALEVAKLNTSMLVGEAKQQEDLNNKLEGFRINHEGIIEGYEKELALAEKIGDASTRQQAIDEINRQIEAQNALYNKQVEAANWEMNYNNLKKTSGNLMDKVFGDPDDVQAKMDKNKELLTNFMSEVNAIEAGGAGSFVAGNMGEELSAESMGFLTKMLKLPPDQLEEEFATKQDQFTSFADFIQQKMAEATAAENENLSIGKQWADKQKQWMGEIGSSIGDAVTDWITGTKSIGDAMREMVADLLSSAINLMTRWVATYGALLAFGSTPKDASKGANKMVLGIDSKATGGYVTGPGTGTSDSIPTMLSNGEYVINAAAVRQVGLPFLNSLNAGEMVLPAIPQGYADGGAVGYTNGINFAEHGGGGSAPAEAGGQRSVTIQVSTLDASSFEDFLRNGGLDRIKQALFDDDRNFASAAGVW